MILGLKNFMIISRKHFSAAADDWRLLIIQALLHRQTDKF